jgi:hypothetical protein
MKPKKNFYIDGNIIEWKDLREQKQVLLCMRDAGYTNKDEDKSITSIIHFIDYIQDKACDSGMFTEKEIFG